jgi:ABC-type multidrug transport system fused ATPase/permease subunit
MISEVRILKELRAFFSEVRIAKELANRKEWPLSRRRGDIFGDRIRHTRERIAREYQLVKYYAGNWRELRSERQMGSPKGNGCVFANSPDLIWESPLKSKSVASDFAPRSKSRYNLIPRPLGPSKLEVNEDGYGVAPGRNFRTLSGVQIRRATVQAFVLMPKGRAMLEARGLSKSYGSVPAVQNITFRLEPGQVLGYLGPNGSGKSTTVKMLTGLLQPTHGEVTQDGEDIHKDLVGYRKRLGYVPEEANLYPYLTGEEYLDMIGTLRAMAESRRKSRIDSLLQLFALTPHRHVAVGSYSKACANAFS